MTPEEAIQYFNDEIRFCRAAPSINGCQMTEDWQRTIDACEIAVSAIAAVSAFDAERSQAYLGKIIDLLRNNEGCDNCCFEDECSPDVCTLNQEAANIIEDAVKNSKFAQIDANDLFWKNFQLNKKLQELGPIDHLRDLLQAERDGRLVVLPQKTLWELTMDAGPDCDMKCPVDAWDEALGCDLCSKAKQFAYERPCTQGLLKELGKTVFLTREEAEAALKGDNGNA